MPGDKERRKRDCSHLSTSIDECDNDGPRVDGTAWAVQLRHLRQIRHRRWYLHCLCTHVMSHHVLPRPQMPLPRTSASRLSSAEIPTAFFSPRNTSHSPTARTKSARCVIYHIPCFYCCCVWRRRKDKCRRQKGHRRDDLNRLSTILAGTLVRICLASMVKRLLNYSRQGKLRKFLLTPRNVTQLQMGPTTSGPHRPAAAHSPVSATSSPKKTRGERKRKGGQSVPGGLNFKRKHQLKLGRDKKERERVQNSLTKGSRKGSERQRW